MKPEDVSVLCLRNPWDGGYQCFDVFYRDTISSFDRMRVNCCIASTYDEACKILSTKRIDFSLSIGKYQFYRDGLALYDRFKITNYEWIIDNPFKYSENTESEYNRLIMIDSEFKLMPGFDRPDYLTLPLGMPDEQYPSGNERKKGILVPWKLRDLSVLKRNIDDSPMSKDIWRFIDSFDNEKSFIRQFVPFLEECSIADDRMFFRLANDYIRMKKRINMLNSIKEYPLVLLSDQSFPFLKGKNISYLQTGDYMTTLSLQKKYKYVLNNNPNYDMCLHDRVSHACANGATVISDESTFLRQIGFPLTVRYSKFDEIDEMVLCADECGKDYGLQQRKCLEAYRMTNVLSELIMYHFETDGRK